MVRYIILFIVGITLLSTILFFIISNSTLVTQKIFDKIAPQYGIHYKSVKGNLYKGVTLEDVYYRDALLAKKIILKYDPAALLHKELRITRLEILDANVETIKQFVASFQKDKNAEKERSLHDKNNQSIGLTINANDVFISALPFEEQNITINTAQIKIKHLQYNLEDSHMEAEGFESGIESNLGKIRVSGDLKEEILKLQHLSLEKMNTEIIQRLLDQADRMSQNHDQSTENTVTPKLPFKEIVVVRGTASIMPRIYSELAIEHMKLDVKELDILLKESPHIRSGFLSLVLLTDLAEGNYSGKLVNDTLTGKIVLKPRKKLYRKFDLPLRPGAVQEITADINASKEKVTIWAATRAKQLLKAKEGDFNLDLEKLHSKIIYEIPNELLVATSEALVDTSYAKKIRITNDLKYDGNISYNGEIYSPKFEQPEKLRSLLEALVIQYRGTQNTLNAKLETKYLKGKLDSKDLVHGLLHLENKKTIKFSSLVSLPNDLNSSVIRKLQVDAPINFKNPSQVAPHMILDSNLIHIDVKSTYEKVMKLQGTVQIPKDSLLREYQQNIRWENVSPLKVNGTLSGKNAVLKIKSKLLNAMVQYGLKQEVMEANVDINGLKLTAKGKPQETVTLHTTIDSLEKLEYTIKGLYRLDASLPPIKGSITMDAKIEQMKDALLIIDAPKLIYMPEHGKQEQIENLKISMRLNKNTLMIPAYQFIYNEQKFFATKTSTIKLDDTTILLSEFWVNDTLKIEGKYNLKTSEGAFDAKADRFHIKDKITDIYAKIDLETQIKGLDTLVKGKIILLGGTISPKVQSKTFVTDSDIVILQEMKKNKKSGFMEHLSVMVRVEAVKPIVFQQPNMYLLLKPDITIYKDKGGKLLYLGTVVILEGSYYRFKDKKFVLKKSYVYFTGDINKPLLDIKATYKSLKYIITITVTGTPEAPNINFSSSPPLSKEQILSVILFGSEAGGDTHSGDELMRMMGGVMAKAALADLGVKVDHLVFGENGSIEVGKKINDKITVIYVRGDVPVIKVIYKHSKTTESVFGVSERSKSYDIIYKRDVKKIKDIFKKDGS